MLEWLFLEAVMAGEDGMLGVSYDHFAVIVIQAINEQQGMIETLTTRIEKIEAQIRK